MDICTVTQFRDSLNSPQKLLRTLHNLLFEPDTLCCSKHFAEACATIEGKRVMLYAPITPQASDMVHEAIKGLQVANGKLSDMHIIDEEILYSGLLSGKCCMIVESMPLGIPLSEAMHTLSRTHLLMGLNKLISHLKRYDLSHNYLNIYNIIVDSNYTWHTIRNYHITQGYGNDTAILRELKRSINNSAMPDSTATVNRERLLLNSIIKDKKDEILYPIQESLRKFETPNGVGFKDRHNRVVINDVYSWASNFEEERAIVRLKDGNMGIINRQGDYIIQPLYDNIEYDTYTGISCAYKDKQCTKFNYLGEVIE